MFGCQQRASVTEEFAVNQLSLMILHQPAVRQVPFLVRSHSPSAALHWIVRRCSPQIRCSSKQTQNRPSETTKLSAVLGVLNVSLWESWHLFPCLTRMNPPGVCAVRSRRLKVCREESACWGLKCMRGSGRSSGSYRSFSID